jgi:hypothetical protein
MTRSLHSIRLSALVAALVAGVACTGRSQGTPAGAPPAASTSPPGSREAPARDSIGWLASDSAARTASMSLVVTRPAGASSALINGYRAGEAQIVVPVGWTIKWDWRNTDAGEPHSLVVMTQREKVPLEGGRAAFSNAMTRMVTAGLASGQTDQTIFEADEAGWFWLLCGVPGHALNGEWIELRINPDSKSARVEVKKPRP